VTTPVPTRKRSRRWLRLVAPFAVVVVLVVVSAIMYGLQQPDPTDPAFLSPTSDAPIGGARLAQKLRDHGLTVVRVTKTSDALVAAYSGDATLFIPAPGLVHPFYLRMLKLMPASTTLVLVAPSGRTLADGRLPITVDGQRWASAVREPGCDLPAAASAGPAVALRERFAAADPVEPIRYRCYAGGLVGIGWHDTELRVVGATDPFRNDRIAEHGNATLATGLLNAHPRVIWLDLHRREPRPGYIDDPRAAAGGPAPPSLAPGSPDPDFPIGNTGNDPADRAPQAGGGGAGGNGGGGGSNPLLTAFPPSWYPTALLLLLAGVLLALAAGRRLGPPVREPLPVTVRATETLEGRVRLYARAKARGPALSTLRTAAQQRLIRLLDLPTDADPVDVCTAVAAQAGGTPDEVREVLYGAEPSDDKELLQSAKRLDALLHAVSRTGPATHDEGERW
jgi:hypothetical protein